MKNEKSVEIKPTMIEEKKPDFVNNENLFGLKNIGNTCIFNIRKFTK